MKTKIIFLFFGLTLVGCSKLNKVGSLPATQTSNTPKCSKEALLDLKIKLIARIAFGSPAYTLNLSEGELMNPCFPGELKEKYMTAKEAFEALREIVKMSPSPNRQEKESQINDQIKLYDQELAKFLEIKTAEESPSPNAGTPPTSCFKYPATSTHPDDILTTGPKKPYIDLIVTKAEIVEDQIKIQGRVDGSCSDEELPEIGLFQDPNDYTIDFILLETAQPKNGKYEFSTKIATPVLLIRSLNSDIGVISDYFSVRQENGVFKITARRA